MADFTQSHVRGLQRVWVPEHSCWVFVWCADDGELDRNHRIAYTCISSPAEFSPQKGQFVLAPKNSNACYVYGVPYAIESFNGTVKVYYVDLTPALGWPRFALGEDAPSNPPLAKYPKAFGFCLEGQFARESSTNGPILWFLKDQNLHNNPLPVIEVADTASVLANKGFYGAPSGALCVEYQRDERGRIKTDPDGFPLVAEIVTDDQNTHRYTTQNYKVGYLALSFKENYFGVGLHGWIGASAPNTPFYTSVASIPTGTSPAPDQVWLKVNLYSTLMASIRCDDKITITGLDAAFYIDPTESDPSRYIWLEVDIRPLSEDPPTVRLASIESGTKDDWNGNEGDFFPHPIKFDTDDGTPTGSDPDTTPDNRQQTHFYVPIAYTILHDDTDIYEYPGIMLTDKIKLIQQLNTHLIVSQTCYRGDDVEYILPFHSYFTLPPT